MTAEQLQWLLAMVSNAPIQNTEQARIKAAWLADISDRLDVKTKKDE